jgi:hypothetical protein
MANWIKDEKGRNHQKPGKCVSNIYKNRALLSDETCSGENILKGLFFTNRWTENGISTIFHSSEFS